MGYKLVPLDLCKFNRFLQVFWVTYCGVSIGKVLRCQFIVELLSISKSSFQNGDLVVEVSFFKIEFLLADYSVFLVTLNCLAKERFLLLKDIEELLCRVSLLVNLLVGQNYRFNYPATGDRRWLVAACLNLILLLQFVNNRQICQPASILSWLMSLLLFQLCFC